jgi:arsenical pump membrane protein
MTPTPAHIAIWIIAALATAGVIARPFRWPEAVWAVGGAVLLLASGLLSWRAGFAAVGKGLDVYLFLGGMILLSEIGRREGLFDWLAAHAVNRAGGSRKRLFALIYAVGVLVTVFLSNDATAVVLTPAVYAAARKAKADPLPYLFVCAFTANAASFVLPISNPANLVLYAGHMPALGDWLARFAAASALSILATYAVLRWSQRKALEGRCESAVEAPALTAGGRTALLGIAATAGGLLVVSAAGWPLGLPTGLLGLATDAAVLARERRSPWTLIAGAPWAVLPLVAGLFVLVEAVSQTGVAAALAHGLAAGAQESLRPTAAGAATVLALLCNLINNLPAGLLAATAIGQAHAPTRLVDGLLIGVDLGPNLSITGSLATILWLSAVRREGEHVNFWRFFKVGALVMPPALALALAARLLPV